MTSSPTNPCEGKPAFRALAPAKLNLTLDVLGVRSDGYHELHSLVVGAGLFDRIRCRAEGTGSVKLNCNHDALANDSNLAYQAAMLLASRCGTRSGLRIELLEKVIPIGAGLGGGSSDAAAALRLCNLVWGTGWHEEDLARLGAEIGSDVPVFFHLPSAVMRGRGEQVEAVSLRWSGWGLLVFGGQIVSTSKVYRAWRRADGRAMATGADEAAIEATSAKDLSSLLSNHLEPAVFRVAPEVKQVYDELVKLGVGEVRVSGAGSAMYVLFDDEASARHAAKSVKENNIGAGAVVVRAPIRAPSPAAEELVHGDFRRTSAAAGRPQRPPQGFLQHHTG
jgi:4-diphosphocytidyl-2-C-methyl-D-erythritol kinase